MCTTHSINTPEDNNIRKSASFGVPGGQAMIPFYHERLLLRDMVSRLEQIMTGNGVCVATKLTTWKYITYRFK